MTFVEKCGTCRVQSADRANLEDKSRKFVQYQLYFLFFFVVHYWFSSKSAKSNGILFLCCIIFLIAQYFVETINSNSMKFVFIFHCSCLPVVSNISLLRFIWKCVVSNKCYEPVHSHLGALLLASVFDRHLFYLKYPDWCAGISISQGIAYPFSTFSRFSSIGFICIN